MSGLSKSERSLRSLARVHGIQIKYRDGTGTKRVVASETIKILLTSMGIACQSDEEVLREIGQARAKRKTQFLDSVYVVWKDQPPGTWWVNLPMDKGEIGHLKVSWNLLGEKDMQESFELSGHDFLVDDSWKFKGKSYVRVSIPLTEQCLPGYYRLHVRVMGLPEVLTGEAWLIVAPSRCYIPSRPLHAWGLTAQLYGIRSGRNWGIGDFRDLTTLAEWAGPQLGVDAIGLNPMHALTPSIVSPYSPSSRLFHNPLYLDIEGIEESKAEPIQAKIKSPEFQTRLKNLREGETVDYEAVRAIKGELFDILYEVFVESQQKPETDHAGAFERFLDDQGRALESFAVFQVLQEHHPGVVWKHWPQPFQNPDSSEVSTFAQQHRERIRFYQYLEWQCVKQLEALSQTMKRTGMTLGLYHDLAIGIHPDGADAWMFRKQLAEEVEVGAPPDTFNLSGQTWGLQPPLPEQLRESGYQFIRDTFRQNMEYGGMLRIDHALGLFRLYWVPTGCKGSEGAYVHYQSEELLAILALESVRHRVMVVGEDLGTVTPAIRKRLSEAGLLSYRLLMFERNKNGGYRRPGQFPAQALLSVNTHDLPTLRGFWVEKDIDVKEQAGLYPSGEQAQQERISRVREREAVFQALKKENLLPAGMDESTGVLNSWPDGLCQALYAYLARSRCWVMATSLEDLLEEVETPNVPGAPDHAYPVWRKKLGRYLEEIADDQKFLDFAAVIKRERETSASHLSG